MIDTTRPNPEVYLLAAGLVRLGNEPDLAILNSVEKLHPEIAGIENFKAETFNWKWEHLHQYRSAFGDLSDYGKPSFTKKETSKIGIRLDPISPELLSLRRAVIGHSLEMMAVLCAL